MKYFKNKYNELFSNIKVDNSKEKEILDNIYREPKFYLNKKKYVLPIIIVIICVLGLTFGNNIVSAIKKMYIINERDSKSATCIIPNAILEVKNKNAYYEFAEEKLYNEKEIEEILDINLLSNEYFDELMQSMKTKDNNGLLAYAYFKRNTIDAKKKYKDAWDNAKIELSMSFLTTDASDDMKNVKSAFDENYHDGNDEFDGWEANRFELSNCSDNNFDIVHIDHLSTDLYMINFHKKIYNDMNKTEYHIFAWLEYNNVLYEIYGEWVSRNMIIDFVKTLK